MVLAQGRFVDVKIKSEMENGAGGNTAMSNIGNDTGILSSDNRKVLCSF